MRNFQMGQALVGPHIIGSGAFLSGNWGKLENAEVDRIWTGERWASDDFGVEPKIYASFGDAKDDMKNVPFMGHFVAILFIGDLERAER